MIKIGMTGTQGTGKTSMAEAMLAGAFGRFSMVPSTARQIKAYGYPINREATELSQLLVPLLRVLDEHEESLKPEVALYRQGIISDRTIIDSLAYTMYQVENVWEDGAFIEQVTKRLLKMHMKTYHYVLYFPIYWDGVNDGIRDNDKEYRQKIDSNIKQILDLTNINYVTVPDVSPKERVQWFQDTIHRQAVEAERTYIRSFGGML